MALALQLVIGGGGTLAIALTLFQVFEVMLLPRRLSRPRRLVRAYFRGTWCVWRKLAWGRGARGSRSELFAVYGPLSMAGLLACWTAVLVTGFAAVQWAIARGEGGSLSAFEQLYSSGVTFFTLGDAAATSRTSLGRALSVGEAGVGFGFIAVTIGYLPVLYQALLAARTAGHRARRPQSDAGDRLTSAGWAELLDRLRAVGLGFEREEAAYVALRKSRASYERHLEALAGYLVLPVPRWFPELRAPARGGASDVSASR